MPQRHFSLSYSFCKLKKIHDIVSLFSLELKALVRALTDKLPHLQGVVIFWILTKIIPLPLIRVSCFHTVRGDNCYIPQWKMLFYVHPLMSSCLVLEILPVRNSYINIASVLWTSKHHQHAKIQYKNEKQLKCIYLLTIMQMCNQCNLFIGLHNSQISKVSSLFITNTNFGECFYSLKTDKNTFSESTWNCQISGVV